jgi:acetyltransferase-like isoleucine patch superfamily enzyme
MKHIGKNTIIEDSAVLNAESYYIGDNCYIGPGVTITAEKFVLGDYSKIHKGTFVYSQPDKFDNGGVYIGHNAWVGQNAVLDGTGGLFAGKNLGVGIASHLYSHILFGDVLEGSRFNSTGKLEIGDDVWFVGFCLVSPIKAEDRSMALLGSNVTRDMLANHIYAGNPAKDITEKAGNQFLDRSIDEKGSDLRALISEFFDQNNDLNRDRIAVVDSWPSDMDKEITYINLAERTYSKTLSEEEVAFLSWSIKFRAKFTPKLDHLDSIKLQIMEE